MIELYCRAINVNSKLYYTVGHDGSNRGSTSAEAKVRHKRPSGAAANCAGGGRSAVRGGWTDCSPSMITKLDNSNRVCKDKACMKSHSFPGVRRGGDPRVVHCIVRNEKGVLNVSSNVLNKIGAAYDVKRDGNDCPSQW